MFEIWKQKVVKMVVVIAVGRGVSAVSKKAPHPTALWKL